MKVVVLDLRNFAEEEKENLLKALEEQRGAMSHEDAMMEFVLGKLQPQKRDEETIYSEMKKYVKNLAEQLGISLEDTISSVISDKAAGV